MSPLSCNEPRVSSPWQTRKYEKIRAVNQVYILMFSAENINPNWLANIEKCIDGQIVKTERDREAGK